MPGANYMGGRRNNVKARAKDTISRQQKSHFGRQHLDILARGVSALKPSELAHAKPGTSSITYKPTAQDIDLAHAHGRARTTLPVRPGSASDQVQKRYIPSPIHVLPSLRSPRSRASMRAPSAPEKSKTRSALCDALDMSDPVFMRRILDEILAMPDLAGLGKCKQKPKSEEWPVTMNRSPSARSPSSQSQSRSHSSNQQSSRQRPETPPPFRNSAQDISLSDYDADFGYLATTVRGPSTPHAPRSVRARQYSPGSPIADFKHKISPSYDAGDAAEGSSCRGEPSSVQRSFHDSVFSKNDEWYSEKAVSDSSPSWSTRFNDAYSSPRSVIQSSGMDDDWIENTRVCEGADAGFQSDALAVASPLSGIPAVIEFGQPRHQQQRPARQVSVYGTLFEQQDPWKAIGVILGIEEKGGHSDVGDPPPVIDSRATADVDVDVEVPLDVDHVDDQLLEDFGAAFGSVADEGMSWEEDEDELDIDWDCQFSTMSKGSHQGPSRLERRPVEIALENWGSAQMEDTLDEPERNDRPDRKPVVDLGDDDARDGMLVDGENKLEIDRPLTLDIDDNTGDGVPLDDLQESSETEQGRVLEMPVLDEVDGKFLGPTLCGADFSSSEDE